MTCLVIGTGLVGCYLGAAAGAVAAVAGPSGRVAAAAVKLPVGLRRWRPRMVSFAQGVAAGGPMVVACRSHQTPWAGLPRRARVAQNGLGQPRSPVVGFFALDRRADGVVAAVGLRPRVVMESGGHAWAPVVAAWRAAGIAVDEVADVRPAQWEKAILNATVGPLCLAFALERADAVWGDAELRTLCLAATVEGERVAAASGVVIPAGIVGRAERFFSAVGAHRPSVLRGAGELPWVLGQIIAAGKTHGVAMPALTAIAARVAAVAGPEVVLPPVMPASVPVERVRAGGMAFSMGAAVDAAAT